MLYIATANTFHNNFIRKNTLLQKDSVSIHCDTTLNLIENALTAIITISLEAFIVTVRTSESVSVTVANNNSNSLSSTLC